MLPGRFSRLPHHVYKTGDIDLLKLNVMYGANGAGKSKMIKALSLLKSFVLDGKMPIEFITQTFKFDKESRTKDVYLGIEFIKDDVPYYYGLTINQGIVIEEELQVSGLGRKDDKNLFLRTDEVNQRSLKVQFANDIKDNAEVEFFTDMLQNESLKPNVPLLNWMMEKKSKVFEVYRKTLFWFENDLEIIFPESKVRGLALRIESSSTFKTFANDIMQSFNTGISRINVAKGDAEQFFGKEDKQYLEVITAEIRANPDKVYPHYTPHNEELIFYLEDDRLKIKKLVLNHRENDENTFFQVSEESDGTKRLLEYLLAFFNLVSTGKTFLIDEIERSIHPLLIKELIKKFSHDENTKGQLIFSTHESNLLDQDIFRPDEIWFAEKNKEGATEFSALSDFKEHHTIDIRKGYLNGRYGGIPFLGNLKDLNWDKYAEA